MTLRTCIALVLGCGLAAGCEAVGSVGAVLDSDESSLESSSSGAVHDESRDDASSSSTTDRDDTMPVTGDRDPTTSEDSGVGGSTSAADDGTSDEGPSTYETDVGDDSAGSEGGGVDGCCAPADGPGCADFMIESCVCELDAYCCEKAWDEVCANTAKDSGCSPCAGEQPLQLDCCTSSAAPGCMDQSVQECVCATDPYCCAQAWDQTCVDTVDMLGCGVCNLQ